MNTYDYPKEATTNDLAKLLDRAEVTFSKKQTVDFWSIAATIFLPFLVLASSSLYLD